MEIVLGGPWGPSPASAAGREGRGWWEGAQDLASRGRGGMRAFWLFRPVFLASECKTK